MDSVMAFHVVVRDVIEIRGEEIEVDSDVLECQNCEGSFDCKEYPAKTLEVAYKIYRNKHIMLTPKDFKNYRLRLKLTQKEMSSLLGWDYKTLSLYEDGALQSLSNDRSFKMAMTDNGLEALLNSLGDGGLSKRIKSKIICNIH